MYINTSPAPDNCIYISTSLALEKCVKILLWRRKGVCKYFLGFSGAGEVYLNTSPAPEKYFYICTYLIPLRRRRSQESICIHLSGAGEVFIYTYLKPEKFYIHCAIANVTAMCNYICNTLVCGFLLTVPMGLQTTDDPLYPCRRDKKVGG